MLPTWQLDNNSSHYFTLARTQLETWFSANRSCKVGIAGFAQLRNVTAMPFQYADAQSKRFDLLMETQLFAEEFLHTRHSCVVPADKTLHCKARQCSRDVCLSRRLRKLEKVFMHGSAHPPFLLHSTLHSVYYNTAGNCVTFNEQQRQTG